MAAAGAHNCLMTGSPGAGKTLMARSLPSILPRLSLDEALDIAHLLGDGQADGTGSGQRKYRL